MTLPFILTKKLFLPFYVNYTRLQITWIDKEKELFLVLLHSNGAIKQQVTAFSLSVFII